MADNNGSKEIIRLDFKTNADQAAKDVNNLNVSIEQTTESVDDNTKAVNKQEDGYKSLKAQLREANQELQKAVQIYGETSKEAVNAAKGVAELKDQMEFAGDLADSFNPDQKFKALGAATQVAATGMQGITAGMALFGDQSEDTEKALLKVQSAMAFSDAISQISQLGDQWSLLRATITSSSIATKANAAATGAAAIVQNLFTGSVNASSTGFKALKVAIAGTGIGLLVVGLVALVNNFDKVTAVVKKFVPGLAEAGDMIMNVVNAVTDFIGVTSESERALDRMKSNADKSLALNKKFLQEHGSQLDEYTKAKIEAVNEYHELIKEDGANQVALYAELNRKLASQDKARQDEIDQKRKEAAEKAAKAAEEERKKREEAEKKRKDDEQKRIDDANKKRAEDYQKQLDDLVEFEAERERAKEELQKPIEEKEAQDRADEIEKANSLFAFKKALADQEQKDKEARLEQDRANREALVSGGEQLIKNIQQLAGKNKAIQKAAIIADGAIALGKAGVNTAEAVTKDLAKGAPFSAPLVALDIAVGATSAAAIISNTTKALQAVGGGSAPSSPNLPTAQGVSAQPQTGFQASSENQIATSINQSKEVPLIKTFVVAQDVTTQQGLDAGVVAANSFGGASNP